MTYGDFFIIIPSPLSSSFTVKSLKALENNVVISALYRCSIICSDEWIPLLGHKKLNCSNTLALCKRLGNADRDIVTAATTPAHLSCCNVDTLSMTSGAFKLFGLIQRI